MPKEPFHLLPHLCGSLPRRFVITADESHQVGNHNLRSHANRAQHVDANTHSHTHNQAVHTCARTDSMVYTHPHSSCTSRTHKKKPLHKHMCTFTHSGSAKGVLQPRLEHVFPHCTPRNVNIICTHCTYPLLIKIKHNFK